MTIEFDSVTVWAILFALYIKSFCGFLKLLVEAAYAENKWHATKAFISILVVCFGAGFCLYKLKYG